MEHKCINETRIKRLENAIFGDKTTCEKGMKEKVDEMHTLLIQGNAIKRFIVWMFACGMGLIGAIYTMIRIYKETKD